MARNFWQMSMGEVEKLEKELAQQFLDNPAIAMKHLKDGYMPDGIEKLYVSPFHMFQAFKTTLYPSVLWDV
jgi:hypothetical protein